MTRAQGHTELPPFSIRRNDRARRVRLRITPRDGLVVTLPPRVPESVAVGAVREREAWARAGLARLGGIPEAIAEGPPALLPQRIELRLLAGTLDVVYEQRDVRSVRIAHDADGATVAGPVDDAEACVAALGRWRDRLARSALPPFVESRAVELGVRPTRVSVRHQRSRWGSYSSAGTLSLNRDLIFLPEPLVDHIVVHELAHTVHPNHSARFHALVEEWRPDARRRREELKEAWRYVPAWAIY